MSMADFTKAKVRRPAPSNGKRNLRKKFDAEVKEENYRRIERAYGTFHRSFTLPNTVDTSKVSADFKNGVLTVTLPFKEEAKPRTINVEVA